ncbi:MAG: S8/S53 family peptidase [Candidatus Neomarinimicrobiota bacterium]
MKSLILYTLLIPFSFAQKIDLKVLELGKRGNEYRVWIYFKDKAGSEKINATQEAHLRRLKHGSRSDYNWYDLKIDPDYIDAIRSLGLTVENQSRWLNAISVICSEADLDSIALFSFVEKIEPVKGYKKKHFEVGEDIHPSSRDFDYGNAQTQIEQINVHELHNQGYTGEGVRILVIDTGFDLSHNAFQSINVIDQWDVINDDSETANQNEDEQNINQDSHGTKILSLIAANMPGELLGTAFDAEFLLAKTEDVSQEIQQEEDNLVAGLEWGELNGADIVSISLGYFDWYEYEDMDGNTAVTTIAIDIAVSLGLVCVTGAGNWATIDWYYIAAPADADSVISVGAVNDIGEIASFSSRGPTFDGRIKPEICAMGVSVWHVSSNNTTDYVTASGTSSSTPLTAGAIALMRQARPDLSPMQLREAVLMTASIADSPNNTYGYGILDAFEALSYWSTSSIGDSQPYSDSYNILKTYPNPFNPSINIEITSVEESITDVSIISFSGQFVKNIFKGKISNSTQTISWEPDNLSSGIYLVRLINDKNQSRYKKITYLK